MILLDTVSKRSCGNGAERAVIKSIVSTALKAITHSYLRASPTTPTDFTGRNTANAWLVFSYQPDLWSSSMKIASASLKISAYSFFTSPKILTPSPGPGNGWRNTICFGSPRVSPIFRTSSLKSSFSGSTSLNFISEGNPPTL